MKGLTSSVCGSRIGQAEVAVLPSVSVLVRTAALENRSGILCESASLSFEFVGHGLVVVFCAHAM